MNKKKIKYSPSFERDFSWHLSMRNIFNFDGNGDSTAIYDKNGVSGKEAFYLYDSTGKKFATKHPNIFLGILKTKGSINLHIKMYAEDRAAGLMTKKELDAICADFNAPQWFIQAVENQKYKYWKDNKSELADNSPEIGPEEIRTAFQKDFDTKNFTKIDVAKTGFFWSPLVL